MDFPFYMVIVTQCQDCGGEQTVKVFQDKPTEEQKYTTGEGSICEDVKIVCVENDEDIFCCF